MNAAHVTTVCPAHNNGQASHVSHVTSNDRAPACDATVNEKVAAAAVAEGRGVRGMLGTHIHRNTHTAHPALSEHKNTMTSATSRAEAARPPGKRCRRP